MPRRASYTTLVLTPESSPRIAQPRCEPRFVDLACRNREHRVDCLLDIEPIGRPDAVVEFHE